MGLFRIGWYSTLEISLAIKVNYGNFEEKDLILFWGVSTMSWKDKPITIKGIETLNISAESWNDLRELLGWILINRELVEKEIDVENLLKKIKAELSMREIQASIDEPNPDKRELPLLKKESVKEWWKQANSLRKLDRLLDISSLEMKNLVDLYNWLHDLPVVRVPLRERPYGKNLLKKVKAEFSRRVNEDITPPKWMWWEKKWWQWWKKPTETDLKSLYLGLNIAAQATKDLYILSEQLYKTPDSVYRTKLLVKVISEQKQRMAEQYKVYDYKPFEQTSRILAQKVKTLLGRGEIAYVTYIFDKNTHLHAGISLIPVYQKSQGQTRAARNDRLEITPEVFESIDCIESFLRKVLPENGLVKIATREEFQSRIQLL